jgi:two-component system cell cycle sensor histidine kinase/response regulator CckA
MVLLVDDEDALRGGIQDYLETIGYTVVPANSGSAALRILQERSREIDVVVTDVVMPNVTGPELARTMKLLYPSMPVIFMSGYSDEAHESGGSGLHGYPLLRKPFPMNLLAERLGEVLPHKTSLS